MAACIHWPYCSSSIMKRMNSLAAFGYLLYLKIIWLKNRFNSVCTPAGPIGMLAWLMSATISLSFGSCEVLAA
ncbi:MAG: hypothetical protein A3I63_04565 [Betaproteobacteria bacterium RIFCSPLOWO2_02_FULL_66_14]|nr:MAG: hypothetical protein A3I63_04565 [Betaproteobacteria bacterium RIFCSPLOWO2_02_FULL_66_14]